MSLNLREIFDTNYLKGYFNRNKRIFIISIILFIVLGSIGTMTNSNTMNFDGNKNRVIKAIITRSGVRKAIDDCNELIKDAIISTEIVFVLLLIAAFIETFITPALLNMI